jgi:hypothetical protein
MLGDAPNFLALRNVFDQFLHQLFAHFAHFANHVEIFILTAFGAGKKEMLFDRDEIHDRDRQILIGGQILEILLFHLVNLIDEFVKILDGIIFSHIFFVIPAEAGIQKIIYRKQSWIPACAGMTE